MASYPGAVYEPREKEQRSGVEYIPEKKSVIFVEDVSGLDDEVVAVETELGTEPKGIYANVKVRLEAIEAAVDTKITGAQVPGFETDPEAMAYLDQAVKIASSPTFAGLTLTGIANLIGQTLDKARYLDIEAGVGYGVRFWDSDAYKIHMGNAAENKYGPVTDYSIKMNMSATAGRGWVWGVSGAAPVAALDNTGKLQIASDFLCLGIAKANVISEYTAAAGVTIDGLLIKDAVAEIDGGIGWTIDGMGAVIPAGHQADLRVPFKCEIVSAVLLAKEVGSIKIDIWKDTYANFPPTDADTITAGNEPKLVAANKSEDIVLTGWTKTINAGDCLRFNVDSCTTITKVILILKTKRRA